MIKILKLIFCLVCLYAIFIIAESYRLKESNEEPLIILDKDKCNETDKVCYDDNGKYEEKIYSLGFTLKNVYYLDEKSTDDNLIYHQVEQEFYLFDKILIWGWIS